MEHRERMEQYQARIAAALDAYSSGIDSELFSAMRYSLLPPGKCVRPIVLLEFYRICGGEGEAALPFACALEMLHTYSLIHDDLPCMDDDDMRRGRPANHKAYGEAIALLAGSSLLSLVFETVLSPDCRPSLPPRHLLDAAYVLAEASGARGMAGGQALDIRQSVGMDLEHMYALKTGALFKAAAKCGSILAGAGDAAVEAAGRFGAALGFAFQLADDLLDKAQDEHSLYCLHGEAWCRERIEGLHAEALDALRPFEHTDFLQWLTGRLASRQN